MDKRKKELKDLGLELRGVLKLAEAKKITTKRELVSQLAEIRRRNRRSWSRRRQYVPDYNRVLGMALKDYGISQADAKRLIVDTADFDNLQIEMSNCAWCGAEYPSERMTLHEHKGVDQELCASCAHNIQL